MEETEGKINYMLRVSSGPGGRSVLLLKHVHGAVCMCSRRLRPLLTHVGACALCWAGLH